MSKVRIHPTPRRRPRPVEIAPLRTSGYVPDTSATDDLLDRIAAILEMV